jgi:hypothetical protein
MTHDDLWVGVDLKIRAARTTLEDMRKAHRPPTATIVLRIHRRYCGWS